MSSTIQIAALKVQNVATFKKKRKKKNSCNRNFLSKKTVGVSDYLKRSQAKRNLHWWINWKEKYMLPSASLETAYTEIFVDASWTIQQKRMLFRVCLKERVKKSWSTNSDMTKL